MRSLALLVVCGLVHTAAADPLPYTKPLTAGGDLAKQMVDGIHKYLDRELEAAPRKRDELWKAKAGEPIADKRSRLAKQLGVVDERLPKKIEWVGTNGDRDSQVTPGLVGGCHVHRIRWDV